MVALGLHAQKQVDVLTIDSGATRCAPWGFMNVASPAGLPVPSCTFLASLGSGPQELHSLSSCYPSHVLCFGSGNIFI